MCFSQLSHALLEKHESEKEAPRFNANEVYRILR